jgi:hypothetical protein|tara:strand:+ start:544 stop:861 length:318 start_codon:yes stop_codon:yes gene_type:complete
MLTDYQIARQTHHDNGSWTVVLRIHEGEITTEDEAGEDLVLRAVTRYRRTNLLRAVMLQFGVVSATEVVRLCRVELATDATRTPIDEQTDGYAIVFSPVVIAVEE